MAAREIELNLKIEIEQLEQIKKLLSEIDVLVKQIFGQQES